MNNWLLTRLLLGGRSNELLVNRALFQIDAFLRYQATGKLDFNALPDPGIPGDLYLSNDGTNDGLAIFIKDAWNFIPGLPGMQFNIGPIPYHFQNDAWIGGTIQIPFDSTVTYANGVFTPMVLSAPLDVLFGVINSDNFVHQNVSPIFDVSYSIRMLSAIEATVRFVTGGTIVYEDFFQSNSTFLSAINAGIFKWRDLIGANLQVQISPTANTTLTGELNISIPRL